MYYPIGWPRILDGRGATGGAPLQLLRHRVKNIVFELREHSIAVWNTRLHILLASFKLSPGNINKHGVNCCSALKPDGSCLAIATSNGLVYFLSIVYGSSNDASSNWKYSFREHGISTHHTPGLELPNEGPPLEQVSLILSHEVSIGSCILVLCPVAGSLMVPTDDSTIMRINWEGIIDKSHCIDLKKLSFINDQPLDSKGETHEFVVDINYSLELHGLAIVTSDGKVAFITAKSARFQPQSLEGFWLKETTDCVCVAINPKYNLIVCGRNNGLVDCYIHDESTRSWILTNTLQLSKLHFADSDQYQLGPVQCLIWSPVDCCVLVVVWKNGGLSMWSVFGSLLFHSLGNQPGTPTPLFRSQSTLIQSACWSIDGYQLWMLPRGEQLLNRSKSFQKKPDSDESDLSDKDDTDDNNDSDEQNSIANMMVAGSHLIVLQFLKSGFVNNPVIPNHNQLLLHSADQVYLGPPSSSMTTDKKGFKSNGSRYGTDANAIGGLGKAEGIVPQWNIIQFPSTYLVLNWPIQFVSLSDNGDYLVIVGKAGFAIYLMKKRKWKLFGSELQEQNLLCRGGVTWYKDVLVYPCRLNEKKLEEIHFYNINDNLDASRVLQVIPLSSAVVKVNTLKNNLVIASRDCSITIYTMDLLKGRDKSIGLNVYKVTIIPFASYISHPWISTLVSIIPSTIRTETGQTSGDSLESILLNIGGNAIMLQKEQSRSKTLSNGNQDSDSWVFSPPVSLAPYVEAIWTPPINSGQLMDKDYMMESLWLSCGAHGIKVWLPLYPQDEAHHTFLSKRIMLTLPSSSSFPQCIMLSEAVIVGVSHEPLHGDHTLRTPLYFPPTTVRRITRLFLNHVLRQLLKRNLGSHAFHIAQRHATLPYFAHILELMLHEILEEEASCSIPIPDALLPRAIEFIKQFPQFLLTVGSCARKTEIALWRYLFAAVGNPKDLFEVCLSDTKLKTAATYLIIIQNLEPASVSRHMASRLLDSALDNNQWDLCRDLVRFLKAIGPVDGSNPTSPVGSVSFVAQPTSNPKTPKSAGTPKNLGNVLSSNLVPDLDQSVASITRHHLSSGNVSNIVSVSGDYYDSSGKVVKRPHFSLDIDTKEEYFIELILSRHARDLLSSNCIRDLGMFASHLDFDLALWMSKERHRAAHVDDYVKALLELHKQFHWPIPLSSCLTTPTSKTSDEQHAFETVVMKGDLNTLTRDIEPIVSIPEDSIDFKANFRRPNRPPDLNIPSNVIETNVVETDTIVETLLPSELTASSSTSALEEEIIVHSSTPSKLSAAESFSYASDSMIKNVSSDRLIQPDDHEVTVEMLESWENGSAENSPWFTPTKAIQSENEIKYFVELTRHAMCLEWNMLLGILLQDVNVFSDTLEQLKEITPSDVTLPDKMWVWLLEGINTLSDWASKTSPGYIHFLASITPIIHQYQPVIIEHLQAQQKELATLTTTTATTEQTVQIDNIVETQLPKEITPEDTTAIDIANQQNDDNNSSGCVLS